MSARYLRKRDARIYQMRVVENIPIRSIAKQMSLSESRISQIVSREAKGKPFVKPTDKARDELVNIIALYNGKVHPMNIAKMYGVSDRFIRILLEDANVYKGRVSKAQLREMPVELDESKPEHAYFLGFVAGKGVLHLKTNVLTVEHHDYGILCSLSRIVFPEKPAKSNVERGDEFSVLSFKSQPLVSRLVSRGVVSAAGSFPSVIPGELLRSGHFWRGFIDGNGRIGVTADGQPFITVATASTQIRDGLVMFLGNEVSLSLGASDSLWRLYLTDRPLLSFILKSLYLDAPKEIRLPRNYERALVLLESDTAGF